jgi:hypothetical protein
LMRSQPLRLAPRARPSAQTLISFLRRSICFCYSA